MSGPFIGLCPGAGLDTEGVGETVLLNNAFPGPFMSIFMPTKTAALNKIIPNNLISAGRPVEPGVGWYFSPSS